MYMGRVVVAGSINMDVVATAERHPKIGETVAGHEVLYFPGGKGANQAVAAAKLGAPTMLIGRLGQDAFGSELKVFLAAQGVDLRFVRETPEVHTGTAIITVANSDNTIVVIPGANALVTPDDVAAVPLALDILAAGLGAGAQADGEREEPAPHAVIIAAAPARIRVSGRDVGRGWTRPASAARRALRRPGRPGRAAP